MSRRLSLRNVVDKVKNAEQLGQGELSILGGRCPTSLREFFESWNLDSMPYRIWEHASEITIAKDAPLTRDELLMRGRLFGEGGDLEVLRTEGGYGWRFVGPAGVFPLEAGFQTKNYWEEHPGYSFRCYEKTSLLWGQYDGRRWYDSRVAGASLQYPGKGDRLSLRYKAFSRGGLVQFVWYVSIETWEGERGV